VFALTLPLPLPLLLVLVFLVFVFVVVADAASTAAVDRYITLCTQIEPSELGPVNPGPSSRSSDRIAPLQT
jgi:hypothetical protein